MVSGVTESGCKRIIFLVEKEMVLLQRVVMTLSADTTTVGKLLLLELIKNPMEDQKALNIQLNPILPAENCSKIRFDGCNSAAIYDKD